MKSIDLLNKFIDEIGPADKLSATEERNLINKWRNENNKRAFEILVKKSQYIVFEEVIRLYESNIEIMDLIQEGNLALIISISKWNTNTNLKSFLHINIYRKLQNIIYENYNMVRIPLNIMLDINTYKNDVENYFLEHQEVPSVDYMKKYCKQNIYNYYYNSKSGVINPILLYGINDIEWFIDDNQVFREIEKESLSVEIDNSFIILNNNERIAIKKYFGFDSDFQSSLEDIAKMLNCTRERIRQIKNKGIEKLSHKKRKAILQKYLNFGSINEYNISIIKKAYKQNNDINDNKLLDIIKEYVEPNRRKTIYPKINISEKCRKIIIKYLAERGEPVSFCSIKKHVHDKLPLVNDDHIYYALNSSSAIQSIHNNLYVLKSWISQNNKKQNSILQQKYNKSVINITINELELIEINKVQLTLIKYFIENNRTLSDFQVRVFNRCDNIDYEKQVEPLNKKFIARYNEKLIVEQDFNYILNEKFSFIF